MIILVDTSVIIDYLRRKDPENSLFVKIRDDYSMVVSFITVAELFSGSSIRDQKTHELVEKILGGMKIKMTSLEQTKKSGLLREQYKMSLGDSFIAQLALEQDLPLATLNVKDFEKVKEIKIFKA